MLHRQYMAEALASLRCPTKSPAKSAVTSPHPTPVKSSNPEKGKKRQRDATKAAVEETPQKSAAASEAEDDSNDAYVKQHRRERARAERLAKKKPRAAVPDPLSSDEESALNDA